MSLFINIALFLTISLMCALIVTGAVTVAIIVTDLVESKLVRSIHHEQ